MFNRLIRGMLPKFSRSSIKSDNDENNNTAIVYCQPRAYVDVYTHKNIPFLSTGSIVEVKQKEAGLWVYGTIVDDKSDNHDSRRYKIRVIKMEGAFPRTKRYMKIHPNHSRRPSKKFDVKDQLITDSKQI